MKAAILNVKLGHFEQFTARRRQNARTYDRLLADRPVETPYVPEGHEPVYHQYSILTDRRDELAGHLKDAGVHTGVYYPVGLHEQACFRSFRRGSLPATERSCRRILSLPCHPMLSEDDLAYVASCIGSFGEAGACGTGGVRAASGAAAR
jgi:dTDP-4-amino-4,6-dideoxygalactose transaminase